MRQPVLTGRGVDRLRAGDERIVLTGAGGWLGLATLELLYNTLGADAFARRIRCFGSSARTLELRGGLSVAQAPLTALADLPAMPTLLLHHAFLTKDKAERMDDAAFVAGNLAIREQVLAALDGIGVEAIFIPSSGAALAADDDGAAAAMRLYGRLKREDEDIFAGWAASRGRRAVIVRVFNVSGPYINKPSAYALAEFILEAQAGRALTVRATRRVMRSFVAVRELMAIVFGLLTERGGAVTRFDTAGEEPLEMEALARAVAAVIGPVDVTRVALQDDGVDRYVGDRDAYRAHAAAQQVPLVSLACQIRETAEFLARAAA